MDAETIRKWFEEEMEMIKQWPNVSISPARSAELERLEAQELPPFTPATNPSDSQCSTTRGDS